jgi:hypothetical protein
VRRLYGDCAGEREESLSCFVFHKGGDRDDVEVVPTVDGVSLRLGS